MSFVLGMATGYETSKFAQERLSRRHLREYIERCGIAMTDRDGKPVSVDQFLAAVLPYHPAVRWKTFALGGLLIIALLGGIWLWGLL